MKVQLSSSIRKSLQSMRLVPSLLVIVAVLAVEMPSSLSAATVAHWQFEDSPGFTADSGPNGLTLSTVGDPQKVGLPSSGRGGNFDDAPGVSTSKAADFDGNDSFSTSGAALSNLQDFTVEAFVNLDTLNAGNDRDTIVSIWETSTSARKFRFELDNGTMRAPLAKTGNGSVATGVESDLTITAGDDWYVAVAVDISKTGAGGTVFYAKNLTDDGPLLVDNDETRPDVDSLYNPSSTTPFEIGRADSVFREPDGIYDEIHISDTQLSQSELLINIPEPGSFMLVGLGGGLILFRRKRRSA